MRHQDSTRERKRKKTRRVIGGLTCSSVGLGSLKRKREGMGWPFKASHPTKQAPALDGRAEQRTLGANRVVKNDATFGRKEAESCFVNTPPRAGIFIVKTPIENNVFTRLRRHLQEAAPRLSKFENSCFYQKGLQRVQFTCLHIRRLERDVKVSDSP